MKDKISVDMSKECWDVVVKSLKNFKVFGTEYNRSKRTEKDKFNVAVEEIKRQLAEEGTMGEEKGLTQGGFPQEEVSQAYDKVVEAVNKLKDLNLKNGNRLTLVARFETFHNGDDLYDFQHLAYGEKIDCIGLADHLKHNLEQDETETDFIEIL